MKLILKKENRTMKNKEKFKNEIVDIVCNGGSIAVDNITYEPVDCNTVDCGTCLFYGCGVCSDVLIEWARREYKKPIVISYKDNLFLNFIKDEYKYIARDKNGGLYAHNTTPIKYEYNGVWIGGSEILMNKFNVDFPMIKWSDEQPWKISDLKKLKVVKNY